MSSSLTAPEPIIELRNVTRRFDDNGFIAVDRRMQTSVPRCYACGDCTGKPLQIAKAVGEGCVAAISCAEDVTKA